MAYNTSNTLNEKSSVLSRVLHTFLYLVIGMIVAAAIFMSLARAATPYLNAHKATLTQWISQLLGPNIELENLELAWHGVSPILRLHNVSFYQKKNVTQPIIHVDAVNIGINITNSIRTWTFQPGVIILSGAQINLWQHDDGQISINSTSNTSSSSDTHYQPVISWLFNQRHIALHNLQLHIHLHDKKTIELSDVHVNLVNSHHHHQLNGNLTLHQSHLKPSHIHFNTELTSTLSAKEIKQASSLSDLLAQITGKLYLNAADFSLATWLPTHHIRGWQITNGIGHIETWLNWQGDTQTLQADANIDMNKFRLQQTIKKQSYQHEHVSGTLALRINPRRWHFSINDLRFDRKKAAKSHAIAIDGIVDNGHIGAINTVWLSNLQLDWLTKMSQFDLFADSQIPALLHNNALSGNLNDIYLHLDHSTSHPTWVVLAKFNQLRTQPWQHFPGVAGLSGQLQIMPYHGTILVDSQNALVNAPELFTKPLLFSQLQSTIEWTQTQQGWFIDINDIHAVNPNLNVYGNSHIVIPLTNLPTTVDMALGFDITQLSQLANVYPSRITPAGLADWLDHNVIDGDTLSGKMLLRGPIDDFPFNQQQGIFRVDASVKNLTFIPADGWPAFTNVDANLTIDKGHFQFNVAKTHLYNNTVNTVNAEIVAMDKATPLIIRGRVKGNLSDVQHYLLDTPLVDDLPLLDLVKGSGNVSGELTLQIPLDDDTHFQTRADIHFDNSALSLPYDLPPLSNIKGNLTVNDDSVSALDIKAAWLQHPSNINITTQRKKNENIILVKTTGILDQAVLKNYLEPSWQNYFSGKTPFTLQLRYSTDPKQPTTTTVNSDLLGLKINAVSPLNKQSSQTRPSQLVLDFSKNALNKMTFHYGGELAGAFDFNQKNNTIKTGHIVFGSQKAEITKNSGITLSGHLPYLDANTWITLLTDKKDIPATSPTTPSLFNTLTSQLQRIELSFDHLDLFKQSLTPAKVKATLAAKQTQLQLDSPQLAADLTIPTDLSKDPISGVIKHWQVQLTKQQQNTFDPAILPSLDLQINKLIVDKDVIGQLSLRSQPIKNGVAIQRIRLKNRYGALTANGKWLHDKKSDHSQLQGHVDTSHLNRLLAYWGRINDIEGTSANLAFDLKWDAALFSPSLAKVSGNTTITLGEGRIINIGDSAKSSDMNIGRLLNVFNLSSLSRRLRLDFSDLTKKGYSFDSVKGYFVLHRGIASTSNTVVKGSIADLHLAGDINTNNKSYNLFLTVLPHLTSSLPVIATVAGTATLGPIGAAIGAATWLVDKAVLSPSVGKLTSYTYKITGPWDHPNMVASKQVTVKSAKPSR